MIGQCVIIPTSSQNPIERFDQRTSTGQLSYRTTALIETRTFYPRKLPSHRLSRQWMRKTLLHQPFHIQSTSITHPLLADYDLSKYPSLPYNKSHQGSCEHQPPLFPPESIGSSSAPPYKTRTPHRDCYGSELHRTAPYSVLPHVRR